MISSTKVLLGENRLFKSYLQLFQFSFYFVEKSCGSSIYPVEIDGMTDGILEYPLNQSYTHYSTCYWRFTGHSGKVVYANIKPK